MDFQEDELEKIDEELKIDLWDVLEYKVSTSIHHFTHLHIFTLLFFVYLTLKARKHSIICKNCKRQVQKFGLFKAFKLGIKKMNSGGKFTIPKRKRGNEDEETNRLNKSAKIVQPDYQTGAHVEPKKSPVFEKGEKVAYYHTRFNKVQYGVIKDFAKGSFLIGHENGTVHSIRRDTVVKLTTPL